MTDSLMLFQWAVLSLSALCIGMSKTGVQGMMLLVIAIGAVAGVFIVRIFPEKAFRRFIQGVTVLSVIMMLV